MSKRNKRSIDQSILKELISYLPETGEFIWKERTAKDMNWRILSWWNEKYAGKVAGVIQRDTESLSYFLITIHGVCYRSHRLAWLYMTGEFPKNQIDHINGNGLDNRWANLREASPKDNARNRKKNSKNTSGVNGVEWNKAAQKWRVIIGNGEKNICLGYFENLAEAAQIRKQAEINYGYHENHGRTI